MKTEILNTLEYSKNLIISPDMDGFMTEEIYKGCCAGCTCTNPHRSEPLPEE